MECAAGRSSHSASTRFRFSAGRDFKEKLERLAEVLGIESATKCMPELIERALDLALERKDPKRKLERRRMREARAARRDFSPKSAGAPPASSPRLEEDAADWRPRSRYIPSAVRERVLERASYECEYTGPEARRCAARTGLQIDHIRPHGKGGSSEEGNLRVLCRGHNLFAASREYGEEFLREKIGEKGPAVLSSG